jgi:uncharacterized protein
MSNEPFRPWLLACLIVALATLSLNETGQAATACVWRVVDAPVPFYLVGTIHALSGSDYPLPKPYDLALHDSQQLLFELDPNPKSNFSHDFARAAIYPKGDIIQHHVHPQTWEFLAKNFRVSNYFRHSYRFGDYLFDNIDQIRPWAIAYFVWGIHGYNDIFTGHGVDNHLAYQAKRLGKQTGGLETDQEHIDVLRNMNDTDSEIILLDALIRGDKRREDYDETRAAWKRGDTATMWAKEQRFRNESPHADMRLLDFRNAKWLPRIEREMKSGKPTAIVVGSLHMCGENGLVAILERRGHKVEQL